MPHPCSPRFTSRSAFTLIELLTVIAIIGILAAILFPAIGSIRASARGTVCSNNFRKMIIATHQFIADYGRYPGNTWCQPTIGPSSAPERNEEQIVRYIDPKHTANSPWIFQCPDVTVALSQMGVSLKSLTVHEITYAFNQDMHDLKPAAIRNPAKLVAFQEGLSKAFYPSQGSKGVGDYTISRHGYRASGDRMDVDGRGTKCAFADGHVGEIRLENGKWNLSGTASTTPFLAP